MKNEEMGKVKTRLAKDVGDQKAMEIYRILVTHTRNVAAKIATDRAVFYSWYLPEDEAWNAAGFEEYVQRGEGLGEKMEYAFRDSFKLGFENVVIIGSDCWDLQRRHLENAFRALETHDFVIGPALDGGYYLLGMNRMHTAFFRDKKWSTDQVFSATMQDARRLQLKIHQLEPLSDIDNLQDLESRAALKSKIENRGSAFKNQ